MQQKDKMSSLFVLSSSVIAPADTQNLKQEMLD